MRTNVGDLHREIGQWDRTTSLSLDAHSAAFIAGQVAEGHFSSADEVVIAGLRLLEEREDKLAALRSALIDGENSGEATPFDFDEFLAGKR